MSAVRKVSGKGSSSSSPPGRSNSHSISHSVSHSAHSVAHGMAHSVTHSAQSVAHTFSHGAQKVGHAAAHTAHAVGAAVGGAAHIVGDALDDMKATVLPDPDVPAERIDAQTPEDRWFTPSQGWPSEPAALDLPQLPSSVDKWVPPTEICPTAAEAPFLFRGRAQLGEVRVEILQAENLPRLVQIGRVDPYAVVIFEHYAAMTHVKRNNRHPQWGVESPRAFRFPVSCPYSNIHVALMDEDQGTDDPIGRVVVDLGQLYPRTVYDCWWPLQCGARKRHVGQRGLVRLRLSVVWRSETIRMLGYFKPWPTFAVPFKKRQMLKDCAFVTRGKYDPARFKWGIFQSYLHEIEATARAFVDAASGYLFWHYPVCSVVVFLFYQVVVSNPLMLPAGITIYCFALLLQMALFHQPTTPIRKQPPAWQLVVNGLYGGQGGALNCDPDDADLSDVQEASDGSSSDEDPTLPGSGDDAAEKETTTPDRDRKDSKKGSGGSKRSKSKTRGFFRGKRPPLPEELERIRLEVEDEVSNEDGQGKDMGIFAMLRLSTVLQPIHTILFQVLVVLRMITRLLTWESSALSVLASAILAVVSLVLILLAWLLYFLPWSMICEWLFRIAGAAVLGPHMYWVGKKVEAQRAEQRKLEREFDEATNEERKQILAEHKRKMLEEAQKRLDEEAGRTADIKDDMTLEALAKYSLLANRPLPNACKLRYLHRPLARRSYAYSRFPAEDRPPPKRNAEA